MATVASIVSRILYRTPAVGRQVALNTALSHALRTAHLAQKLGMQNGRPVRSGALSKFSRQPTYLQTGYNEYGGAIKGHAALGYYEQYAAPAYEELHSMEEEAKNGDYGATRILNDRKKSFLKKRGVRTPDAHVDKIDCVHLSLWETFMRRPMVCPTSGSFGYAFVRTLEKLRNTEIDLGVAGRVPLLSQDEGRVILWMPSPGTGVMPPEKNEYISRQAIKMGCPPKYWTEDRDIISLEDTLESKGFYCSTNPKSQKELQALLEDIVYKRGYTFIESHADVLKDFGIVYSKRKGTPLITIESPMSASIYGLMSAKIDSMEMLLQNPEVKSESTFNQPSAGSTLAASALTNIIFSDPEVISEENRLILRENYPNVSAAFIDRSREAIQFHLFGCFDTANPALADLLGYKGIIYNTKQMPANGLGSFSSSDESVRWLEEASCGEHPSFFGGNSMLVCPHNIMQVSRVMIFIANIENSGEEASYPESAGAAGFGGWLHEKVVAGKISARDIAYFMRINGVDKKIFSNLVDIELFNSEAEINGGKMTEFTKELLQAMSPTVPLESIRSNRSKVTEPEISTSDALMFVNTGSNGTQHLQKYAKDIITNKMQIYRESDRSIFSAV